MKDFSKVRRSKLKRLKSRNINQFWPIENKLMVQRQYMTFLPSYSSSQLLNYLPIRLQQRTKNHFGFLFSIKLFFLLLSEPLFENIFWRQTNFKNNLSSKGATAPENSSCSNKKAFSKHPYWKQVQFKNSFCSENFSMTTDNVLWTFGKGSASLTLTFELSCPN